MRVIKSRRLQKQVSAVTLSNECLEKTANFTNNRLTSKGNCSLACAVRTYKRTIIEDHVTQTILDYWFSIILLHHVYWSGHKTQNSPHIQSINAFWIFDIWKLSGGGEVNKSEWELPHQAKAIEPLNPFCFAIEKRPPSKYSSVVAKKGERGKRKQFLFIEGTLFWSLLFAFISCLSKQHKCTCSSKTNKVQKGMDR